MIACICRQIYEEDYADDESLRTRIMEEDWRCGQCQLRYDYMFLSAVVEELNSPTIED